MKRILNVISTALLLVILIAPTQARALTNPFVGDGTEVPPVQYLRMGITIQPLPMYENMAGRIASVAAELQSSKDKSVFFAFPAVSGRRFVKEANFYIMTRTGSYSGNVTMKLEVYDFAGNLQHVVSAGSVNLQTAAPQTWTRLELSSVIADHLIEPGEFLAFQFALDGAPGGNLDVRPVFEVTVGPISIYLPLVKR